MMDFSKFCGFSKQGKFFFIHKLAVMWFDGLEIHWHLARLWPRPKPEKLMICASNGEINGTFIPTPETARLMQNDYVNHVKSGAVYGIQRPDTEMWPDIIE